MLFESLRIYAQVLLVFLINTLILVSLTKEQAIKQDKNWSQDNLFHCLAATNCFIPIKKLLGGEIISFCWSSAFLPPDGEISESNHISPSI